MMVLREGVFHELIRMGETGAGVTQYPPYEWVSLLQERPVNANNNYLESQLVSHVFLFFINW